MNNMRLKRTRPPLKLKIAAWIMIAAFISALIYRGAIALNSWFDTHYFQFNQVLTLIWKKPVEIKERKPKVVVNIVELDNLEPIEQYICDKWGVYDCKTALAVARAESGMREQALNINGNNTIDVGIFQINSVHFKKDGCNLKDIVDQYKNVDCAYQIYEAQGWTPWVAFNSGNFKTHLD